MPRWTEELRQRHSEHKKQFWANPENRQKMIERLRATKPRGEKSAHWKGDKVGYYWLHNYMLQQIPKPEVCPMCGQLPTLYKDGKRRFDLANITGIYNRESENWKYLCRSCHIKFDFENGLRTRKGRERRPHIAKRLNKE